MPHNPSVVVRLLFFFWTVFSVVMGFIISVFASFFLRFFESVETFMVFGFTLIIIMSFLKKKFKKNY